MRAAKTKKAGSTAVRSRFVHPGDEVIGFIMPIWKVEEVLKLSKSSIYRLISNKQLEGVKLRNRTWIVHSSVTRLRESRGVKS